MKIVEYAIPIFFLLMLIEFLYGRYKNRNTYRTNDTFSSLAAGILSQTIGVFTRVIKITAYVFVYQNWHWLELEASWQVWVLAFIFYDLCYYSYHRFSHEVNLGWASHIVHHSSEDYNLSTALRQTGTSFVINWFFYMPMALVGIPPLVFVTVAGLNLVYQFWVHTRHIPKLGILEWFFITPSNHRVHHGQNGVYIDRNYGGVFILWDRLFGSFQEELDEEPVIYGIRKPLNTWNPIWANLDYYWQLINDARRSSRIIDMFQLWFRPPGWRPQGLTQKFPINKTDLSQFKQFETGLNQKQSWYSQFQFIWIITLSLIVMSLGPMMDLFLAISCTLVVAFSLYSLSTFLEHKPYSKQLELIRIHLMTATLILLSLGFLKDYMQWLILLAGLQYFSSLFILYKFIGFKQAHNVN